MTNFTIKCLSHNQSRLAMLQTDNELLMNITDTNPNIIKEMKCAVGDFLQDIELPNLIGNHIDPNSYYDKFLEWLKYKKFNLIKNWKIIALPNQFHYLWKCNMIENLHSLTEKKVIEIHKNLY